MLLDHLRVPCWCPICEQHMKGKSTYTYYDYGCCIGCFIEFIEGSENRINKWKEGWRPSKEQVDAYIKRLFP